MTEATHKFTTIQAVLSEGSLDGDGPYHIHGRAIGVGDVTVGASGIPKFWPEETLSTAAPTLSQRPLVRDHDNTTAGVVGEVIEAKFGNNAVLYRAELDDAELAEKVANGRLDVSARIRHDPVDELDEHEEVDALVVTGATFDNLSLVPTGAAPSNSVQIGEADQMSDAELREAFAHETVDDPSDLSTDEETDGAEAAQEAADEFDDADPDDDAADDEMAAQEPEEATDEEGDELEDIGHVAVSEQSSAGWTLTVDQAHYEDAPYFVCAHLRGERYGESNPPLSECLGDAGPFDADEVAENIQIELDQPLTEDARVYATLHYANNGTKSNHITRAGNTVLNSAEVTVAPNTDTPSGVQRPSRWDENGEAPDAVDESSESVDRRRIWMRTAALSANDPTMKLIEIDQSALPEDVDEFESPTVVEGDALDELKAQAKDSDQIVEEMREDLASLGDYREQVEELESEVESLEAQTEEIDEVKSIYAEALADSSPFAEEELMEFPVSTLREKCEDLEHEALNPAPRSQDVDEDELGDDPEEDTELSAKREELSEKVEWYETRGWEAAADRVRGELESLEG